MKEIILATGHLTQVSDCDYDYLNTWNWSLSNKSYAARWGSGGVPVRLHLEVIRLKGEVIPHGYEGDHIDRNKLNNQRENLRVVTKSQNTLNQDIRKNNLSGVNGVSYNARDRKWKAELQIRGVRVLNDSFNTIEEAVAARLEAEKRYL